jgi:hypothetical protein
MKIYVLLISLIILVFVGGFFAVLYIQERPVFQVAATEEETPVEEEKKLQESKKIPSVKLVPDVRETQKLLTVLGYDPGPIDGVEGARTRSALRAFERDNGIHPADGKIDGDTVSRLKEGIRTTGSKKKNISRGDSRRKAARPYELKGDRLGMSLADFKSRHEEWDLLCTSDQRPEHKKANIVACNRESYSRTVAGVETVTFQHSFIDGKLYVIDIVFPHDGYSKVRDAMIAKYGNPSSADNRTYQNRLGGVSVGENLAWRNGVSDILLGELFDLNNSSLIFFHNDLLDVAHAREPGPAVDDL